MANVNTKEAGTILGGYSGKGCTAKLDTFISPCLDERVKEFAEFEHGGEIGMTSDSIVYAVSLVDNEQQRLRLIEDARTEYEERRRSLSTQMQRARSIYDTSKHQREVHEKLLKDAITLETQSKQGMEQFKKQMEEAAVIRDAKLKEEKEMELARASVHTLAVEAEEQRAQAQANVLLNKQRAHYAKYLQEKHAQEMDFMDALGKKQLMDLNELEASLNKIEFLSKHADTLIKGSLDYTPAEVDVEVGVQAQSLPEAHIPTEKPHGSSLRTHIKEVVPAEEVKKGHRHISKHKTTTATIASSEQQRVSAQGEQTVSTR